MFGKLCLYCAGFRVFIFYDVVYNNGASIDFACQHIAFCHDDVIKWEHLPRYWPFVRGILRSAVNSTHKGQWRGALIFSLICAGINGWVNNSEAGDLRRHRAHNDVTLMSFWTILPPQPHRCRNINTICICFMKLLFRNIQNCNISRAYMPGKPNLLIITYLCIISTFSLIYQLEKYEKYISCFIVCFDYPMYVKQCFAKQRICARLTI